MHLQFHARGLWLSVSCFFSVTVGKLIAGEHAMSGSIITSTLPYSSQQLEEDPRLQWTSKNVWSANPKCLK
jgi:hypothetical protein